MPGQLRAAAADAARKCELQMCEAARWGGCKRRVHVIRWREGELACVSSHPFGCPSDTYEVTDGVGSMVARSLR
eukprot:232740-Chlamydomonas_euryale.AAC.6